MDPIPLAILGGTKLKLIVGYGIAFGLVLLYGLYLKRQLGRIEDRIADMARSRGD